MLRGNVGDGGLIDFEWRETLEELARLAHGKSRADLARIFQFALLVVAEVQRSDGARPGARSGESDDDKFLSVDALALDPGFLAAGAVGRICEL